MTMAVDMFLKLDKISGESADAKHKGEIDIVSWQWGVSQTGTMAHGGGGGAGKASFSDLTISHTLDASSPILAMHCATGQHIKSGTLVNRKAGKEQQEYLVIKLTDILITNVSDSAGGDVPHESVSLNYAKIEIEYKAQKADGSLEAPKTFGWNLKENKKV
jgi:type VI secretion system secreted protein Hcp